MQSLLECWKWFASHSECRCTICKFIKMYSYCALFSLFILDLDFFKNLFYTGVQLIYNVVLVSSVQQSDSVIHISILFQILFPRGLLQSIEQSSLYYTVQYYIQYSKNAHTQFFNRQVCTALKREFSIFPKTNKQIINSPGNL